MSACYECYALSGRALERTDHSSKGVLSTVVRHCMGSRNLVNEEALAQWGLSLYKQTKERKKESERVR